MLTNILRRAIALARSPRVGKSPKVSIAISTLNRADVLDEVLGSLEKLEYRNFEVVVVNGPSTDHTRDVLQKWSGKIKIGECPEMRVGRSRNIAISLTSGEIVALLDDDAVPSPDWLGKIVAAYDDPSVGAVGGYVFDVPLDRIEWKTCACSRFGDAETDRQGPTDELVRPGANPFLYLAGCNMSVRRDVLLAIGGYNELFEYAVYDDVEVCARIIDAGHRIEVIQDAIVRHYRAPSRFRDGKQMIKDFYPVVHSRCVFALQCDGADQRLDAISENLLSVRDAFRNLNKSAFETGSLTEEEYRVAYDRMQDALDDGTAAGSKPRKGFSGATKALPFKAFDKSI